MPRKSPELDLDFNIYVDPSCLSEPMEDESPAAQLPAPAEEAQVPADAPDALEELTAKDETKAAEQLGQDVHADGVDEVQELPVAETEDAQQESAADPQQDAQGAEDKEPVPEPQQDKAAADAPAEPSADPEAEDVAQVTPESPDEASAAENSPASDPNLRAEVASEPDTVPGPELAEDPAAEGSDPQAEAQQPPASQAETVVSEAEQQDGSSPGEPAVETPGATISSVEAPSPAEDSTSKEGTHEEVHEDTQTENAGITPTRDMNSDFDEEARNRPPAVDRKTSLRTEALILAAARAVVAKIEKRDSGELAEQEDDEFENSLLSTGSQDTSVLGDGAQSTNDSYGIPNQPQTSESQAPHVPSWSTSGDEGGGSSSHNEPDDDVFSDRSARSSLCSLDPHDLDIKTPHAKENLSRRESFASSRQSPRAVSGFSTISGLSQYDKEQFIPTSREHRMPFRTPSEIRAMQMASPTPSVFSGSSPRSSKRHGGGSSGFPPVSRLSSPIASAQYSPKGRSTPPRLKSRKEAPLVLLHVTLLPLQWVWGGVLSGLDAVNGKALDETGRLFEASEQLKALRDSWRELQDRVGDTVLERGILLPHPQNDYEVLEERLLEALELPLRRRARILECGHYLGPANELGDEEGEYDDDYASQSGGTKEEKRHWCNTCRNEIKYEDLGPGKVFRVKVYASNGLMRAGAWEACWKEMERVDVEVEPIVDSALQNEFEKLGALQLEQEEQRRQELEPERTPEPEPDPRRESLLGQDLRAETPSHQQRAFSAEPEPSQPDPRAALTSSPPPLSMQLTVHPSTEQPLSTSVRAASPSPHHHQPASSRQTEPVDTSEARRLRDEERLREIYGDEAPTPAPAPVQLPAPEQQHHHHQYPHHSYSQLYPHSQPFTAATPLLTDGFGSSLHPEQQHPLRHPHHSGPYSSHSHSLRDIDGEAETAYEHERRRQQHQRQPQATSPRTLDENAGFVELLMEAFKVLLRDPKNVAIIVLCVFLVVLMKSPAFGLGSRQPEVQVPAHVAGGYHPFEPPRQHQDQHQHQEVRRAVEVVPEAVVKEEVLEGLVRERNLVGVVQSFSTEGGAAVVEVGAQGPVEEIVEEIVAEKGEGKLVLLETEAVREVPTVLDETPEIDVSIKAERVDSTPVAEILAWVLLDYPTCTLGEESVSEQTEAVDVVATGHPALEAEPEVEESPADGEASVSTLDSEDSPILETETTRLSLVIGPAAEVENNVDAPELNEADDTSSDVDECSAPTAPAADDDADAPLETDEACPFPADSDPQSDDEDSLPTPSDSVPSSPVFIPGPFVTERKTVRVFETVTETVRVSVVTQTETVSTVVTAVPQTVEETVYETETVRITVSVPVEERAGAAAKGKAKATNVKMAGAKKGSCGGWFSR